MNYSYLMSRTAFLNRHLELSPRCLMLRFIVISFVLFSLLLLIAFSVLHGNSLYNLYAYYSRIYSHSLGFINQEISEVQNNLLEIASMPEYREKLQHEIELHKLKLNPDVPSHSSVFDLPETRSDPFQFLLTDETLWRFMHSVKFVTSDGISISGDFPNLDFEPFPFFNRLNEAVRAGNSTGNFLIREGNRGQAGGGPVTGKFYFFRKVVGSDGLAMGYLLAQVDLDLITRILSGNLPSDHQTAVFSSGQGEDSIYSLYEEVEQYWIDGVGRPISMLSYGKEYSNTLLKMGYSGNYVDYILVNPFAVMRGGETRNIPIVEQLLAHKTPGLLTLNGSYKNYVDTEVLGGGFWIDELNCGMIIELEKDIAFKPYRVVFILFFFILLLSFLITLYLIIWINRLRTAAMEANPLTQLPGNRIINEKIQSFINAGAGAVVYGDLDNFKGYNDTYGFSMGDKVIRFTGEIIKQVLAPYPVKKVFCGHIGGDDFIFVVPEADVTAVAARIGEQFDAGIGSFYKHEDLENGYIQCSSRTGEPVQFPIMSLSMAGILISNYMMKHYLEVSNRCVEAKKVSKKLSGSKLFLDRRT